MLIRNIFLSTALCLMFLAMNCGSNTPSEYPSEDHDRGERNMEWENREKESKPPRDMRMVAKQLGVSTYALREALGEPPHDIEKGATKLGISEKQLMDALAISGHPDNSGEREGLHDNNPLRIAADKLGVDLKELQDALGPPPPNVEAAAQKLGVSESQLRNALRGPASGKPAVKGPDKGGRDEDMSRCVIDSNGYCIFTGRPHVNGLKPGTDEVVDRDGNLLFLINEAVAANISGDVLNATGRPALDGDYLIESSRSGMSDDHKAFHKVMAIMFPIRNALMYDIATVTQPAWDELVRELAKREIKETTYTHGVTPKDNYYGRQGVFDLAKNPDGNNIHHEVMRFLEEASIYLLCHVTSDEFNKMLRDTHPEMHDPCEDASIITKIPF